MVPLLSFTCLYNVGRELCVAKANVNLRIWVLPGFSPVHGLEYHFCFAIFNRAFSGVWRQDYFHLLPKWHVFGSHIDAVGMTLKFYAKMLRYCLSVCHVVFWLVWYFTKYTDRKAVSSSRIFKTSNYSHLSLDDRQRESCQVICLLSKHLTF